MVSLFTASDDINIRQNSIIPVFRHLMILTSDKIRWYLFFCICSYKHQRNFKNSGFSAPDDMTIRQNLSRYNSMVVVFSASDDINIRQNSVISVFLHLMILTSDKIH